MKRKIVISTGEYYHVYNRGVEKRDIFIDHVDYRRFILLLNLFNEEKSVNVRDIKEKCYPRRPTLWMAKSRESLTDIGAYCLMPNHFHFLIKETKEGGIRDFMHKLTTGYTMYFNKRYKRVGPLFQGTFKSEHANTDEYLKYLYSYIHLNPVKLIQPDWKEKGIGDLEKAKKFLRDYEYSSYLDYHDPKIFSSEVINKKSFPEYFSSVNDCDQNIFDWMEFEK